MKTLTIRNVEDIAGQIQDLQDFYNEKTAAGAIRRAVMDASKLRNDLHETKMKLDKLRRNQMTLKSDLSEYLQCVHYTEIKRNRLKSHI